MSSIKGLHNRSDQVHNFSLRTEDGHKLDFSLRSPKGADETVEFIGDFRRTSKELRTHFVSPDELEQLSIDEKLDVVENLFEAKFRFCIKWLHKLSVEDDISEDDCVEAYILVGRVDNEEDKSLYYHIAKTCKLLDLEIDDPNKSKEDKETEDFTS